MKWLRVREMVRKEFIQLFRDRKNRPLLLLAPLIQLTVFGYVVTTDVRLVRVGICDQSHTAQSRRLIDTFSRNAFFHITHTVYQPKHLNELLLSRRADITIQIPADYSSSIGKGKTAKIQILADGSMSNMASVRISYVSTLLNRLNQQMIRENYPQKIEYGELEGRIRTWYNPNLDSQYFYVPAIVAFLVMLLTLLLTSMAIIREKEAGTMEQLIVTPLTPAELILGKTIPFILIALGQMAMVSIFAVAWFKIPMTGSVGLLFAASILFLMSTLGIGLFISTVSKTQQQAMMTNFFFILPFFMLSGFVFPIANMPVGVQWLTYLNPLKYFLIIIRGIFLKGTGFGILWPQFAGLALIGGVVFFGALMRFKKRMD